MSQVVISDKGTFIVYAAEDVERMGIDASRLKPFDLMRDAGIDPDGVVEFLFPSQNKEIS